MKKNIKFLTRIGTYIRQLCNKYLWNCFVGKLIRKKKKYPVAHVWKKNGDCPGDNVWRSFEDTGERPSEPREGEIVRYFRHPSVSGKSVCKHCHHIMNNHGWIDSGGDGVTICPGTIILILNNL